MISKAGTARKRQLPKMPAKYRPEIHFSPNAPAKMPASE